MTSQDQYYEILSALGALTFGFAIWVLREHGWSRRTVVIILFGLLLGQWWFLEYGLASALWTIRGFSP